MEGRWRRNWLTREAVAGGVGEQIVKPVEPERRQQVKPAPSGNLQAILGLDPRHSPATSPANSPTKNHVPAPTSGCTALASPTVARVFMVNRLSEPSWGDFERLG